MEKDIFGYRCNNVKGFDNFNFDFVKNYFQTKIDPEWRQIVD